MNTIPGKILLFLFYPILVISLVVSKSFTDFLTTSKEIYGILLTLPFIGYAGLSWLIGRSKKALQITYADIFVTLYFAYIFIRFYTTSTAHPDAHHFTLMVMYFFVYMVVRGSAAIFRQNNHLLLIGIVGILIIHAVYGLVQLYGFTDNYLPDFKVGGSFGNPGPYGNYLSLLLPFALGVYWFFDPDLPYKQQIKRLAFLGALLTVVVLPGTHARTAWLATLFVVGYLGYHKLDIPQWYRGSKFKKYTWLIVSAGIVLLIVGGMKMYEFKKDSVTGRLFIWQNTWQIIEDHPFFGAGFGNFQVEYNKQQALYFMHYDDEELGMLAGNNNYAFNEYLDMTSEYGFTGLLLFLLATGGVLLRKKPKEGQDHLMYDVGRISVIVVLIQSLVSYPFHSAPITILFFFILALTVNYSHGSSFEIKLPLLKKMAGLGLLILALVFAIRTNQQLKAHKKWKQAHQMVQKDQLQRGFRMYEELYPRLRYSGLFLFNYAAELSVLERHTKSVEIMEEAKQHINDADVYNYLGNSYEGLGQLQKAENAFNRSAHIIPHKLYPKYRLVYIYLKKGQNEKAARLANQVLSMTEKVKSEAGNAIKRDLHDFLEQYMEQRKSSRSLPNSQEDGTHVTP